MSAVNEVISSKGIGEFIKDRSLLILGFGREGRSSYEYLRKHFPEKRIAIADKNEIDIHDGKTEIISGPDYLSRINDFDIVLKSPGISLLDVKIDDDTYVTCQMDLFLKFAPGKKIGVTGTKGKSTTSSLIYSVLKAAGFNTCLIGNIGVPVFEYIDDTADMIPVIEMSCHQLEYTRHSPDIAVITNLYEEHLDHYGSFSNYVDAKMNIAKYQSEEDYLIHNKEQNLEDFTDVSVLKGKKVAVGMNDGENDPFLASLVGINPHLPGRHNAEDEFFAAAVGRILEVSEEDIKEGIKNFKGIPHRLEYAGTFMGVSFYNDCIATVPRSVLLGIEALKKVDTLIVGGMDRGLDYSEFTEKLAESSVNGFICMPETGTKIGKEIKKLNGNKTVVFADTMKEAVTAAYDITAPGKICLISPAASSYNYYKNFEEKGNLFKKEVVEQGRERTEDRLGKIAADFVEAQKTISKVEPLISLYAYPICAEMFVEMGKMPDKWKLRRCDKLLVKKAGLFCNLSGISALLIITILSLSDNPEKRLDELMEARAILREYFPPVPDYISLASVVLSEESDSSAWKQIAEKAKYIYDEIKVEDKLLTIGGDIVFSVILAKSGLDPERVKEETGICRNILREEGFESKSIHSLSRVLALDSDYPEVNCDRFVRLYRSLSEKGFKYGKDYQLPMLGLAALIPSDIEFIAEDIMNVDSYLSEQDMYKGGIPKYSEKVRLMHAAMIVAGSGNHTGEINGINHDIIVAMEITMWMLFDALFIGSSESFRFPDEQEPSALYDYSDVKKEIKEFRDNTSKEIKEGINKIKEKADLTEIETHEFKEKMKELKKDKTKDFKDGLEDLKKKNPFKK